jgi:hypothetical protein
MGSLGASGLGASGAGASGLDDSVSPQAASAHTIIQGCFMR